MDWLKVSYHHVRRRVEQCLLRLYREDKLWLAIPLASIARKIFLREFSIKRKAYRSVEELEELILAARDVHPCDTVEEDDEGGSLAGVKILMIFNAETNFEDVWVKTAANAGFVVDTFYANDISYLPSDASNREVMRREGKKILDKVKEFQPAVILLDVNYLGNANTVNNELVQEIKRSHSCKVVGHMGDYYSKEALRIAKYWSGSLDVVMHGEPSMSSEGISNFHYMHYFVNEESFYPGSERTKDIAFAGSGNVARYPYLTFVKAFAKKRGYRYEITVHDNHDSSALRPADYCRLVRESRAMVNLSARTAPNVRVVTGRVFEAIACKTLLIEERNEAIARIFTPYVHFIPFDSRAELAIAIDFSVNRGDLVDKITETAYRRYWQDRNSKLMWKRIFRLCQVS